uniref:CRN-like CRN12 n=1 Tax=Phytophthora infestans TaxID=4787 RepID=Q2M401_PHYIN|nr:CRN-like CRN12 [Phytophthora infestans]
MVKLFCAIVGVAGSAFEVDIDQTASVSALKKAVKEEKMYQFPADELQLFLAKAGGNAWLSSLTEDVKKLKKGEKTALVKSLTQEEKELQGEDPISECLEGMDPPKVKQIHVLVALPPGTSSAPISDGTDLWLSRFQHSEVAKLTLLPTRGDLNEFIGQPLPVKIGLPQSVFQAWSSPLILGQLLRDKCSS